MKDYGEEREVKWDTPCKIKFLGKRDLQDIIESKECSIRDCESQIKSTKEEISVLKKLPNKEKPPLPDSRACEHFKLKSVVYVYHENKWHRGIVVPGYRTYDGCVSYVLDDYPKSKEGWGCGFSVPCVILEWEYNYFCKNPKDFRIWLDLSDREYNGEKLPINDYYNALIFDKH